MKHPITIFALSGILLAGTAGAAFAQSDSPAPPADAQSGHMGPGGHHPPDPDRELAHLTKKLNLTADQQARIKPILTDRAQQMQALRADTATARPEKFAKMKSIYDESENNLTAVLNDTQKQQYQKMHDEQMKRMQQHRPHGEGDNAAPPPPPA